jgi:hypothetical protein
VPNSIIDYPEEHKSLIARIGDVIDGLESYQAQHADPFIEGLLGDLRFVHRRLLTLTEPFRARSV